MKNFKLIFALFASIFYLYSCESTMNNDTQTEIDLESKEMSISESAIDAVLSFVKDVYPQKYKTLSLTKEALKIEFVTNVSYEKNRFFAPSVDNASRELDTLLCVINFGNDEGFAIVSTQDNQILAVTESGDLSVEDLTMDYTDGDFENEPKAVIANYISNYISLPIPPGGPVTPPDSINMGYAIKGPWVTEPETQIGPFVQISLDQEYPYNVYCKDSLNRYVDAGCGAIAVIQIMSANKYPNTIGDTTYSWDAIINQYETSYDAQKILATWIRTIGDQCGIEYYKGKSSCKTSGVKNCLSLYSRYTNIDTIPNPSYNAVSSMLANETPLYFRGSRIENGDTLGHAWVVDGSIRQKQSTKLYNSEGVLTSEFYEFRNLIHCNWGWKGKCNGYYMMNIFNLTNGAIVPDEESPNSKPKHYNLYIKALTYNLQ
jgi:hypothetical protein